MGNFEFDDDDELYESDDGHASSADPNRSTFADVLARGPESREPAADEAPYNPRAEEEAAEAREAAENEALDRLIRMRTDGPPTLEEQRAEFEAQKAQREAAEFLEFARQDSARIRAEYEAARAVMSGGQAAEPEPVEEISPFDERVMSQGDFERLLAAREAGMDTIPVDRSPHELNELYSALAKSPAPAPDPYEDPADAWDTGDAAGGDVGRWGLG